MTARKHALPSRARDLTKESPFGRLTVIEYAGLTATGKHRRPLWRCQCECGKICVVRANDLVRGQTTSCGCLHREVALKAVTKHGHSPFRGASPEYKTWASAKARCQDKEEKDYGGRGIVMCRGWSDDFASFYADMGPRPSGDHSVDRIDGNANYSCGHCDECLARGWKANCRWADGFQQGRNKRNNVVLEFQGESLCLSEWSERLGIKYGSLLSRVMRGWPVERILTEPLGQSQPKSLKKTG